MTMRRSPRPHVRATVLAAIVVCLGASVVAASGDAPGPPGASPRPLATVWPDPSTVLLFPFFGGAGRDGNDPATAPPTLTVEAGDLWFAPDRITIRSDMPTVLELVDVGQVAHNLIVDDLGLQLHVGPGTSAEVTLSDLPAGTYEFYCSIFGHRRAGMFGTLTVE